MVDGVPVDRPVGAGPGDVLGLSFEGKVLQVVFEVSGEEGRAIDRGPRLGLLSVVGQTVTLDALQPHSIWNKQSGGNLVHRVLGTPE
jgi:hypothetical protein